MNIYYNTKHWFKRVRWLIRRAHVAQRWGNADLNDTPIVLGNAMPKSGSHLIIQVLQGLVKIGPFVNGGFPPVNRAENNQKLSDDDTLKNILLMRNGDIGYGYLQARAPFWDICQNLAMIFVYRDPRDFIISQVFYATEIHEGHGMHRYYTKVLSTMEERINAAIQGVDANDRLSDSALSNVLTKYEKYIGWLSHPSVLCLRFEELITQREMALNKILDFLTQHSSTLLRRWNKSNSDPWSDSNYRLEMLKQAIVPKSSGTFRKGKPGNWREYFSEENKYIFKQVSGDLLFRLGYEKDMNW